jgi:hypothetical protein
MNASVLVPKNNFTMEMQLEIYLLLSVPMLPPSLPPSSPPSQPLLPLTSKILSLCRLLYKKRKIKYNTCSPNKWKVAKQVSLVVTL